jgi:hypothetical protein
MKVVARYSFNNGEKLITAKYPHLVEEIENAITSIDARDHKTKKALRRRCGIGLYTTRRA